MSSKISRILNSNLPLEKVICSKMDLLTNDEFVGKTLHFTHKSLVKYRTICYGSLLIDQYCVQFCDLLFRTHHKLSFGLNLQLKVIHAVNCLCNFSTVGTAGMIWNPWTCRGDYKNRFASPPVRNILCVHFTPFSFICNKSNRRFR